MLKVSMFTADFHFFYVAITLLFDATTDIMTHVCEKLDKAETQHAAMSDNRKYHINWVSCFCLKTLQITTIGYDPMTMGMIP